MDYRGKTISLSRYRGEKPANYICTSHCGHVVEIVPVALGQEHICYAPVRLDQGTVHDWSDRPQAIEEVKARCRSRLRTQFSNRPEASANYKGLEDNIDRLVSLDGNKPAKLTNEPKPADYSAAQNAVFAEIYGGYVRPNYVGKLVFVEIPLAYDESSSGEYIVVAQSGDSLYVVDTTSCLTGIAVLRLPFSDGEEHITILDSYEDDDFVREFIDRLDDMGTEDYDAICCDSAETVSRQLARMLETKVTKGNLLDTMFRSSMFFGPIGTTTPTQSEDRCHRVGCGCGV